MTVEEIKNGLDDAYKKAGDNAYFGNGFHAGVAFAEKKINVDEMYQLLKECWDFIPPTIGTETKSAKLRMKIERLLKK